MKLAALSRIDAHSQMRRSSSYTKRLILTRGDLQAESSDLGPPRLHVFLMKRVKEQGATRGLGLTPLRYVRPKDQRTVLYRRYLAGINEDGLAQASICNQIYSPMVQYYTYNVAVIVRLDLEADERSLGTFLSAIRFHYQLALGSHVVESQTASRRTLHPLRPGMLLTALGSYHSRVNTGHSGRSRMLHCLGMFQLHDFPRSVDLAAVLGVASTVRETQVLKGRNPEVVLAEWAT